MYFIKLIFLITAIINYELVKVSTDEALKHCDCTCGYIWANATTGSLVCNKVGESFPFDGKILWDDGSYSDASFQIVVQSVVGSCCSYIIIVEVGKGSIIGGRYAGQPATIVSNYGDNKPQCVSCQTKSRIGVSHLSGPTFLEIGSQGTPNWKLCKGTVDFYSSPAMTSALQLSTYFHEYRFTECTNCTDADC